MSEGVSIGDVVVLNADHDRRMTVEACTYNKTTGCIVTCVWFDPQGRLIRDSVPREALTMILKREDAQQRVRELCS